MTSTTMTRNRNPVRTIDDLEQHLLRLESEISKLRAQQVRVLRDIDRLQVPFHDGTRSLKEWITGRLDVHPKTAGDLAVLTKADDDLVPDQWEVGMWSTDRTAAMVRLANTGVDQTVLDEAEGHPVSQLGRLAAKHRRTPATDHEQAFSARRMWFQPNLDHTLATGTVIMSGADVDVFLQALDQRADELVATSDPHRPSLEQRRIDALVSLALDTVAPDGDGPAPRRLKTHIFVDAAEAARTNGEAGAITTAGIKIGPSTLEEILCIGETQTTLVDPDGLKTVPTNGDRSPTAAATTCSTGTTDPAPRTDAPAATDSSPTTSSRDPAADHITPTTSPSSAGSTTT